jgi:hypothetical protein
VLGWGQEAVTCAFGNEPLCFNKMWVIYCFDENQLASKEGLCCVQ